MTRRNIAPALGYVENLSKSFHGAFGFSHLLPALVGALLLMLAHLSHYLSSAPIGRVHLFY